MTQSDLDFDVEDLLAKLDSWIAEGRASVFIDNTPWGTQARVEFTESPDFTVSQEEHRMKKALVRSYNDLLVTVHDLDKETDDLTIESLDDLWTLAEAVTEFKQENNIESFGDEEVYAQLGRVTEFSDATRRDFRFAEAVADMFDSRSDLPDWCEPSRVGNLAYLSDSRAAAKNVENLMEDGPAKRELRLWKEFKDDSSRPDVESVVAEAQRRFKAKYGYNTGTWIKKTKTLFTLLGYEPPSEDTVRNAIQES